MAGRKILLAESDLASAFPIASKLRRNGWAVISAQDAAQTMQMARQQRPDAVVLSYRLAGGGGLTALKRIRSSVYTTLIPAICIVPSEAAERQELVAAGASELLAPPPDPEGICVALDRHLQRNGVVPQVPQAVLGSPERKAALADTKLVDSPSEKEFDDLVKLTARLLGVPVALLSLVDTERQFLKAQFGVSEPWRSARQTPLSYSFCQWVVGEGDELVISDASQHEALQKNAGHTELGISAYAGIPFGSNGGEVLGSFCAADTKPRQWTEEELGTLRDLALVSRAHLALRTPSMDKTAKAEAISKAIAAVTRTLARPLPLAGGEDRLALAQIMEELSRRLVQVLAA